MVLERGWREILLTHNLCSHDAPISQKIEGCYHPGVDGGLARFRLKIFI